MSEESTFDGEDGELKPLAIEGKLPLKAVGIENLKEDNPKHMPPHRYLHPWFARRPTPAARLAILASVLPAETDQDELLKLMQIGPKEGVEDIANYVEQKKATEDERNGTLGEHYGYDRPFTSTPTADQREQLHSTLADMWGELPTIVDPTAGGGVIPFESLRYGLPTKANELNPIPSLILKSMLQYPLSVGSIEDSLKQWAERIDERASERLSEYFPTESGRREVSHYAATYSIDCPSCGCEIPVAPTWWLLKRSASDGIAVRPRIVDNKIEYERVSLPEDVSKDEFNPQDGPRSRGSVTCPNCDVVTEDDRIKQLFQRGEFEYELLGTKYISSDGTSEYRAPNEADRRGFARAAERVNSDINLFNLLSFSIPDGKETERTNRHGIEKWRDLFSPRQLLAHYEYMDAFNHYKDRIYDEHSEEAAEAILTVLSFACGKMIDRNSRLSPYSISRGYPENALAGKSYAFQWLFVDNNPSAGDQCYLDIVDRIVNSYEQLVSQVADTNSNPADVTTRDASDLPYDEGQIQSVVIDPPYYSSVMYAELSDIFYVWLTEYLGDVHEGLFTGQLTDKEEEAVANSAQFEGVADEDQSRSELARQDYERKMSDIFSELYRVLEPGGVMTVMFTHKETDAWDTLTMSLINSGFTITATHPITSEMPQRMDVRDGGSADSTLLLVGRKTAGERDEIPSLWDDVRSDTRSVAKEAARDLIDSDVSVTKTDIIISAFGPTLRVFSDAYPVVDDQDNEIRPREALEEAREAVTRVLVEEFLEAEGIDELDRITEWYVLSWLVHESGVFEYDDGRQLGLGIGIDIDDIKRDTKVWGRSRGDIRLRSHDERVQDIQIPPENRSSRTPVNPDDLSFTRSLDGVHAAMHVYDVQGEAACVEWLRERNFDSNTGFNATLSALLQVLPRDHDDWSLARDLAVGRTREVLDLDFGPEVFGDRDEGSQSGLDDFKDDGEDE